MTTKHKNESLKWLQRAEQLKVMAETLIDEYKKFNDELEIIITSEELENDGLKDFLDQLQDELWVARFNHGDAFIYRTERAINNYKENLS